MMHHQIDDDDVRSMLARKADEATVSHDAWQKIAARIAEPAPSRAGRRVAVAGVAVAAAAATVFVANIPGSPTSSVAERSTTTTSAAALPTLIEEPHLFAAPAGLEWTMEETANAYLRRITQLDAGEGDVQLDPGGESGRVLHLDGPVVAEVFLRQLQGRWVVDSAASDLVPIHDPVFEGGLLSAEIGIEAAGELNVLTAGPVEDGRESLEGFPVAFRDQVPVRAALPDARYARVQAVLRTADGATAVSATWVTDHTEVDPAVPTGSIVSVWPAVDEAGLAQLQADADEGLRPDLLDPLGVAGGYLAELLPRDRSAQHYELGAFRQGDETSGEVPYSIDGEEPAGAVLLRRDGPGGVWHVSGVTSRYLELLGTSRFGDGLRAEVQVPLGLGSRLDALARTPGGGVSTGTAELFEHETATTVGLPAIDETRWIQLVLREGDRILAIAVAPVG